MATLNYQSPGDRRFERQGVLRQVFGPSRAEVWRQLAQSIGAQYVDGGFWKGDKVVAKTGQWQVTLDTYTQSSGESSETFTRLRAPFVNRDGFRFTIYRPHLFSHVAEMLGVCDVRIGDAAFDNAFVIKTNNDTKIRELLADATLRSLITSQKRIYFAVKDDEGWFGAHFPDGVDELYFSASGVIKDIERLRGLYDLFALTLNRLCHIGSAYEDDPKIRL